MAGIPFKCCTRTFNHYVCTQCHSVLHKHCIAQKIEMGKVRQLGNSTVICCNNVTDKTLSELEEKNSILEETLSELTMDSQHKSTHIEKIKQNYFDLLNEASEREDKLNKIIKNHEENIVGLQNKIKETESQLNEYKNKSFESCETQTHIDVKTSSTMTNPPFRILYRNTN